MINSYLTERLKTQLTEKMETESEADFADSHAAVSNCNTGCLFSPLLLLASWGLTPDPHIDTTESLKAHLLTLMQTITNTTVVDLSDEEYVTSILPSFEEIIERFGLECVVFLPTPFDKSPTGKKAVVRSPYNEGKAEIRLRFAIIACFGINSDFFPSILSYFYLLMSRTNGEMKKIKFQWDDIRGIAKGRSERNQSQMTIGEEYEDNFFHLDISGRGMVDLMFSNKDLRDSAFRAFNSLKLSRRGCYSSLST